MNLTILSAIVSMILVAKLLFWTDTHRQESRWFYRVLLYVVVLYSARHVINLVLDPTYQPSLWRVYLHLTLFAVGAFMKPHYLPGNRK